MEHSPFLLYLDYDIFELINQEVIKSKNRLTKEYYYNLYINRLYKNDNFFKKIKVDLIFQKITKKRNLTRNVSFVQPLYPFYFKNKILNVKNAIKTCESLN
tara:strand:- start:92 stop:394 length:303 start_codon:yes stop_codon:yes gene_type:complete